MRRTFLQTCCLGLLMLGGAAFAAADAVKPEQPPVKVVYQMSEGLEQAARAMGNLRNHLRADPGARIVVVAHGDGIRFLLRDAADRNGKPFDVQVAALAEQGVEFRVCHNTLTAHDIAPGRLLPQAKLVPSGVAEIARLQAREGYVYLRP